MFLPLACLLLILGSSTFADAKSHHDHHHADYKPHHKKLSTHESRAALTKRHCVPEDYFPCGYYACCANLVCVAKYYTRICERKNSASSVQARMVLQALYPMLSALLGGSLLF